VLPVCLTSQNTLYLHKENNQLIAQTCESISASRRSMIDKWPLVGEAVGTSGPRVTGKPRISCTFDLPFAELTKELLDTKWLYLKQHKDKKNVWQTLTMSGTRDIPLGQMNYIQSEHEVKHAHVCVRMFSLQNHWKDFEVIQYLCMSLKSVKHIYFWFLSNQYNPHTLSHTKIAHFMGGGPYCTKNGI